MTAISDSAITTHAYSWPASGTIGSVKRRKPYPPIFSMIAARITEPPVGASTCASGNHVCTGNIGTLTANATRKAKNSQVCSLHRQRQRGHVRELPAAALQVQVDQPDQHEDRAEEGVQEELDRRVHAPRAAPDADDDEHRDQHRLEEHVEQHRVERAEHADHQAFEDQERGDVLVHALRRSTSTRRSAPARWSAWSARSARPRCRRRRGGSGCRRPGSTACCSTNCMPRWPCRSR